MRPAEVRAKLRKRPFRPIRIYISDGAAYDVRHPEMAAVSRTEVAIGLAPIDDDLPERFAYVDPMHITRIEPIDGRKPPRRGRRTR